MQAYQSWVVARHQGRQRAASPSWSSQSITQAAHDEERIRRAPDGGLRGPRQRRTAHGASVRARFGTLVHALLERAPAQAEVEALTGLAQFLGRGIGATEAELEHAP